MNARSFVIAFFTTAGLIGGVSAGYVLGSGDAGSAPAPSPPMAVLGTSAEPASQVATSTATTVPPSPVPAATSTPAPVLGRVSCTEIRGTAYRSAAERAWFLSNCGPPSTAAPTQAPPTATVTLAVPAPSPTATPQTTSAGDTEPVGPPVAPGVFVTPARSSWPAPSWAVPGRPKERD